jgi:hypothetical protein
VQYPLPGAAIDYYLPAAQTGDISLEVLDASGKPVRKFSSMGNGASEERGLDGGGGDEEEGGGFRMRSGPTRLDKSAGLHRFTWDLRYPGPWMSAARPEGPNGPTAVPGKYSVRLTVGSWSATEPLTVVEDPRVTADGVTEANLQEQFDHNMKVRDLVSEVNKTVARLRAALPSASGEKADALKTLAAKLITPSVRYSQPELQTHITYLYTVTNATDQKIGRDTIERYDFLRKELDLRTKELDSILGK